VKLNFGKSPRSRGPFELIRRPNYWLRSSVGSLVGVMLCVLGVVITKVKLDETVFQVERIHSNAEAATANGVSRRGIVFRLAGTLRKRTRCAIRNAGVGPSSICIN
jgi:hypothetical protein